MKVRSAVCGCPALTTRVPAHAARPLVQIARRLRSHGHKQLVSCGQYSSETENILKKYAAADGNNGGDEKLEKVHATPQPSPALANSGMGPGVFSLLILNFGVFSASKLLQYPVVASLALSHLSPAWWQFVTAMFVHNDWQHLSSNAFSLLIFGRMVEEEEGAAGVWMTYLICGLGGCLASYFSAPHVPALSLGASGAVFGLFTVAVLLKFKASLRKLLEALVLGSFVYKQLSNEVYLYASSRGSGGIGALAGAGASGTGVGHWAHFAGAALGVLGVFLLSQLPAGRGDA